MSGEAQDWGSTAYPDLPQEYMLARVATPLPSPPTITCLICCLRPHSGLHYGVHTCLGDKQFLKRTFQERIIYDRCLEGTCLPKSRGWCQYCRLERCLVSGVNLNLLRVGEVAVKRGTKRTRTPLPLSTESDQHQIPPLDIGVKVKPAPKKRKMEVTPTEEKHVCIVLEILGDNLLTLLTHNHYKGMPIENVKAIGRQVLEALEHLHSVSCVIHTDIKPENVLVVADLSKIKKKASAIRDMVERGETLPPSCVGNNGDNDLKKEEHEGEEDEREDFFGYLAKETVAKTACPGLQARVADMGLVEDIGPNKKHSIQTRDYRAPETILLLPHGPPADIWSVGAMLYELVTGNQLFNIDYDRVLGKLGKQYEELAGGEKVNIDLAQLHLIEKKLGLKIPAKMARKGDKMLFLKGKLRQLEETEDDNRRGTIKQDILELQKDGKLRKKVAAQLDSVLEGMLKIDPSSRDSAKILLNHEFFKK